MILKRMAQLYSFGFRGILNELRAPPHLELHLRTAPSIDGRFYFDVPIASCRNIIQQRYDREENPFLLSMRELIAANRSGAEEILHSYYNSNQPASLWDCFYHSRHLQLDFEPSSKRQLPNLIIPPWDALRRRNHERLKQKKGIHPMIGPQREEAISRHLDRYQIVIESIQRYGYQPNFFGHIQGHVLDRGDDAVFVVTSGKHRMAVLAALGMERIPVSFKRNMPHLFCLGQSGYWPNVVNSMYTVIEAESIFNGFFQQSDCRGTDNASGASAL